MEEGLEAVVVLQYFSFQSLKTSNVYSPQKCMLWLDRPKYDKGLSWKPRSQGDLPQQFSLQNRQHMTGFPGRPIYDMIQVVVFIGGFLDQRQDRDPSEMHRPQILGLGAGSWCFPSFLHGAAIFWVLRSTWARSWMTRLPHIGSPSGEVGAFKAFLNVSPLRIGVLAQCDG